MDRNKYVGKWTETMANHIDMKFSIENIEMLITFLVSNENMTITHQEFVKWCEDYYKNINENEHIEIPQADNEKLSELLEDIYVQWDLFLANTFSLEELQSLNFSKVKLPNKWFEDWSIRLRRI